MRRSVILLFLLAAPASAMDTLALTSSAPIVGGVPTETHGTPLPVTITAYTPAGAVDTAANFAVKIAVFVQGMAPAYSTVSLVSGVASVSANSTVAGSGVVNVNSADALWAKLGIMFN